MEEKVIEFFRRCVYGSSYNIAKWSCKNPVDTSKRMAYEVREALHERAREEAL